MHSKPQYAVFGQPIAHSLSPRIHALFAAEAGIALDYRAIEADRAHFATALEAFAQTGGRGANVTLPLKQDALTLSAEISERARRCGSVNTLTRHGDGWHGDSTDGAGLLRDLRERHAFDPHARSCILLGAGGAARAVAFALADAGVERLAIANRTHERARELADAIDGTSIEAIEWATLERAGAFDLVLHATAAGHGNEALVLPETLIAAQTLCYDLSYGTAATAFLRWSRNAGARRASDGLGMLIEQAAESFAIWHARRPETAPVFAVLDHARFGT
jgi:shikimate dehydrogenase